jgi:hypothetical protein
MLISWVGKLYVSLLYFWVVRISSERQPTSYPQDHDLYQKSLVQSGVILTIPQKLA